DSTLARPQSQRQYGSGQAESRAGTYRWRPSASNSLEPAERSPLRPHRGTSRHRLERPRPWPRCWNAQFPSRNPRLAARPAAARVPVAIGPKEFSVNFAKWYSNRDEAGKTWMADAIY